MIDLVYTDADGIEQGIIKAYSLDLAYGSEENDFKLTLPIDKQLDMRSFVYLDGTEWGGIVRGGKESTLDETPVYVATGKTWHGILSSTFICPASGEDYVTVSGEANAAIGRVLEHVGLSDVFDASTEGSGIEVSHRFERFADCYSGIRKMLNASGAKLKIDKQPGRKPALYAAPISSYIDTDEACRYGSKIEWGTPVNHLICLGKGELADRTVIHLYADEDGNVSQTQTLFGLDEVQEVYDYSSAEDDELLEEGTKKLKELQEVEASELSLPEDAAFDVDDIVGTVSEASGRSITASVSKVIVKIDEDGYARVTNEIGEIKASRSSGVSGGSSGGGVAYTAGDGISISGGVISADVTEGDLDSKADAIHTHAWGDVTGKPSTYQPSAHTHAWKDVIGKPDSYPPSDHNHDGRYYTKAQADAAIKVAATKDEVDVLRAALDGKAPSAHTHAAAGIKSVNASAITGTIAAANLPSYVDDVLEYGSKASFPSTGEAGKIYVDTAANMTYRWSGSAYVEISASVALGETSSTAYRGDRGAAAYKHAVTNKGRAFGSGLYKITTNSEGHVTDASAVGKSDIVGLGIPAQDTVYTHPSSGVTAGTYRSVSVNAQGHVTGGSNPTTLSGYGITDAAPKNHAHDYAGSSSAGGAATSANKLNANAGDANTPVYFSNGVPVACTSLDLSTSGNAATATKATQDGSGQNIADTYIKSLSVSGKVITYTKGDGDTGTITTQDTNTTYSAMTGATSGAAGKSGLVPAPAAGKQASFLRGDGSWAVPTNTVYTHPTGSGYKHIPSGGSSGQILRWSDDGTAVWGADNNTTYDVATSSKNGLMSAADKAKLDAIQSGATSLRWQDVYPVGAYYFSSSPTSPASLFGGTWTAVTGKFLYMNAGTSVGGSNTHTLTVNEMPRHSHDIKMSGQDRYAGIWLSNASEGSLWSIVSPTLKEHLDSGRAPYLYNTNSGGGKAHNNMPAYQTVYAWRRTA